VRRLSPKRLVADWEGLTAGIAWAVEILEEERIFDAARLPTISPLYVLAALHDVLRPLSLDQLGNAKTLVRNYLWRAFVTDRYSSASSTHSLEDLRGLKAILAGTRAEGDLEILNESKYPLPTADKLKSAGWPKSKQILARAILALSMQKGAYDPADATPVNRQNLPTREYHHLFPEHLLAKDGNLRPWEISRALNCALITWRTNRTISAKEPLGYLRERIERATLGESEIRRRLESHLIPFEPLAVGGYEDISDPALRAERIRHQYEGFLDERAQWMLKEIETLCSGFGRPVMPPPIASARP